MNTQDTQQIADLAVVGAGAAGLMTAIQAAGLGLSVLLLDGREKIGAKILMSGGTRCNVTNRAVTEKDYSTGAPHTVRAALKAYTAEETIAFFEELGVPLKLEPTGKYFPLSDRAQDVLDALTARAKQAGVRLVTGRKILRVAQEGGIFTLFSGTENFTARAVVLTTGGLSFPSTGSDGTGYRIAQSFGHTLVSTTASLTPLLTNDADWKSLSGVTVPARLSLWLAGKKVYETTDSFLFTHFGFSGPAALDLSRHWIRANRAKGARVEACFFPNDKEEDATEDLRLAAGLGGKRTVSGWLSRVLPARLADVLLFKTGIEPERMLSYLKKEDRLKLLAAMFRSHLAVNGDMGYEKAEVTAGGVDLAEIGRTTLASKLQPGLFFAGEIVDVDGRIGGFNFQWAWSSGTVAARSAARFLKP
ncbi:MAG: NAD(P)/FAD-dependent oxidoreductase [Candidatus Omnitrophica bacterium]|nr:NAD(P)/FAD-dependent oxidoreductase [Candidatus Omnitrophota bacterium]